MPLKKVNSLLHSVCLSLLFLSLPLNRCWREQQQHQLSTSLPDTFQLNVNYLFERRKWPVIGVCSSFQMWMMSRKRQTHTLWSIDVPQGGWSLFSSFLEIRSQRRIKNNMMELSMSGAEFWPETKAEVWLLNWNDCILMSQNAFWRQRIRVSDWFDLLLLISNHRMPFIVIICPWKSSWNESMAIRIAREKRDKEGWKKGQNFRPLFACMTWRSECDTTSTAWWWW